MTPTGSLGVLLPHETVLFRVMGTGKGRGPLSSSPTFPLLPLLLSSLPVNDNPRTGQDPLSIIWDFDGTLFDTRQRNLAVTRRIVSHVLGQSLEQFSVLRTVEGYDRAQRGVGNWREFYQSHLGLDEEGTDRAGGFWLDYQLKDRTEAPPFDGVVKVIKELSRLPQGIVSQNSRDVILHMLESTCLGSYFASVVGHAEVPMRRQKPEPDGILRCIQEIGQRREGIVLFVGDHETDALTAHNANAQALREGLDLRFVSVAAAYLDEIYPSSWSHQPDFVVRHPSEILDILEEFD